MEVLVEQVAEVEDQCGCCYRAMPARLAEEDQVGGVVLRVGENVGELAVEIAVPFVEGAWGTQCRGVGVRIGTEVSAVGDILVSVIERPAIDEPCGPIIAIVEAREVGMYREEEEAGVDENRLIHRGHGLVLSRVHGKTMVVRLEFKPRGACVAAKSLVQEGTWAVDADKARGTQCLETTGEESKTSEWGLVCGEREVVADRTKGCDLSGRRWTESLGRVGVAIGSPCLVGPLQGHWGGLDPFQTETQGDGLC
jgi:hypothetical protein